MRRSTATRAAFRNSFQSTHPLRGATRSWSWSRRATSFQSTHPLRGATARRICYAKIYQISIHAPLAGCDQHGQHPGDGARQISIHAPLAGCDIVLSVSFFLCRISIHAPLAGCDIFGAPLRRGSHSFQSTHPLRGATADDLARIRDIIISIHAPLAGCDQRIRVRGLDRAVISIHAPLAGCDSGGRPQTTGHYTFQSTHPLRGATDAARFVRDTAGISIHAPLAGCDSKSAQKNAALLRKRYKYKAFVCKKCTSGDLTGAYSSKNTLYSGANCSENPCALSVRTHRISGPSTSNPGLMPKCSILERYFSPR